MIFCAGAVPLFQVYAEAQDEVPRLTVSPQNYRHNIEAIKKMLGSDVKMCLVMKSDAYGHGIKNLIEEAVASDPAYIAAIYNYEFRVIRQEIAKEKKDIALLRIAPVLRDELIESISDGLDVEEIIGSLEEAKMISTVAQELTEKLGRNIIINVHINIEAGMGRMGFRDIGDIKRAMKLPHLKIKGAMTHFSRAYEEGGAGEEATRKQTEEFDRMVARLRLDRSVIRHIANSGAAVKFPWVRKDMVRVGTLTYAEDINGLDPGHELKPVIKSFESRVAIIERDIPPRSPVGYDSLQRTRSKGPSTTATVRIGYSEGFPEMAFNHNMMVLIRGHKFPVLGKTSMNMVVVDITDQDKKDPVQLGDEVILIGRQGDKEITLEEFAAQSGSGITALILMLNRDSIKKEIVVD
jgi:alanine racemase